MAEQSAFLTAFDEMQKKKGGFNAPAPQGSVVDTVGQAPEVQSPFSQQAAAATNPLAEPIDLSAAPAVQAPQELTADSFGPVAFPGLQQQGMDQRLQTAGEEQQRMNAMSSTLSDGQIQKEREGSTVGGFVENAAKKGFDYFFGAPTAEQAQNTLDTMPTDPDQRARLQATAAGEDVPSDLSKAGSFFFGRPEVEGDPNILGAQTPSVETPKFGLADPTLSTATGEDPSSPAPIVTPTATPVADPDQQIRLADPTSSTVGLNSTQAMLQERFGSPTISGIQSAEEGLGMRTDAQGRMIDPSVDRSSFEQASADREARQAARPDFGEAVSDRDRREARGEGISDADRRDIAKANQRGASAGDVARGDKVAAANGIDRKTGKPLEGDGLTVDQQLAIRKQLFTEGEAERKAKVKGEGLTTEAAEGKNRDFAAAEAMFASNQNIAEVGKKAQRQAGQNLTTGIFGAVLSKLKPGSNAADMQANLDTLTADAAFSSLQTMRDNSKTGGALGAISERELTLLGAAQRSLASSQSPEQLKTNIAAYLKLRSESMARVKAGFAKEYGQVAANKTFGGGSSEGSQGGQTGSRHPGDQDHGAKVETHFQGK
jgi:hypothetical protein